MASSSLLFYSFVANRPLASMKVVGIGEDSFTSHIGSFHEGNSIKEVSFPSSLVVSLMRMVLITLSKAIKWKISSREESEVVGSSLVKRKRKNKFSLILDSEYFWILGEVVAYPSDFTSKETIKEFISSFNIYFDSMSEFIIAKDCDPSNSVYLKLSTNRKDFTFVYESSSRSLTYYFLFLLLSVGC